MHIIGIDIDGRAGLSSSSTNLILSADLLFGGKRMLELFPDAKGEKHPIGADLQKIVDVIRANPGKDVVVLASGDPGFFGIADLKGLWGSRLHSPQGNARTGRALGVASPLSTGEGPNRRRKLRWLDMITEQEG